MKTNNDTVYFGSCGGQINKYNLRTELYENDSLQNATASGLEYTYQSGAPIVTLTIV